MKAVFFFIILLLPTFLAAQVTVSGDIIRSTRWFGEVFVDGDVVVQKGVTLSIEPGSRIVFKADSDKIQSGKDPAKIELIVLGTLLANGEKGDGQIIFTTEVSTQKMGSWHGIILKNRNIPSILSNCIIEYAYKGVTCYGSSPEISQCEIRFNQYAGISCEVRSTARIQNCSLVGNDFAGLICELASTPIVEKTVLTQNNNGVIIFDRSQPDLGRYAAKEGESMGENQVSGNYETGIYNRSTLDVYAQNNVWNTDNPADIQDMILDKAFNATYGKVFWEPVFGARPPILSRQVSAEQGPGPDGEAAFAALGVGAAVTIAGTDGNPPETPGENAIPVSLAPSSNTVSELDSLDNQIDSLLQNPLDGASLVTPETLVVYREIFVEKPAAGEEPRITKPVLERQIDSGKRRYAQIAKPEYPEIYKRTGHEGRVIMEVIVGYEGEVESYIILRSNGDYFSSAAENAIKKMRYHPEMFQGKPVRFKIYESFVFKLNQ